MIGGRQGTRQGQMKAELFHYIGITVKRQQIALAWREAVWLAAGNLGLGQGRAEGIKIGHNPCREIAKSSGVALRHQRQEALQIQHLQTRHLNCGQALRQLPYGGAQGFGADPLGQPEGRLDRAVKSVFARIGRHRCQIQPQIGLRHNAARGWIPAQPRSGGLGEWPLFWGVIDGVAFHLFHVAPPSVIVSHPCDKALTRLQVPLA